MPQACLLEVVDYFSKQFIFQNDAHIEIVFQFQQVLKRGGLQQFYRQDFIS